jgi:membrane protein YdbS with pleckstrin-like domain
VPEAVEEVDPEGVDYGWVMQVTFVVTILAGAPVVAVLSVWTPLPTWGARAAFAVRVGAVVWILVAVAVYLYARRAAEEESPEDP